MGGSLSAAASQDFTSVSVRGLSEFAPRLIDLVADVAMNPTIPEDEVAILKQQHLQAVSQQKASPQFLANRTFRHGAVRRASLRAHQRDRGVAQRDGPREAGRRSTAITTVRTTRSC